MGMAHAVSISLPKAGEATDTPVDDAVPAGAGVEPRRRCGGSFVNTRQNH